MKLYAKLEGTNDIIELDAEYTQTHKDYVGHTQSDDMYPGLDSRFWKALMQQRPDLYNPRDDWYYGTNVELVQNAQ